ncbi:hypothetical protein F383_08753 [Gossypium arboreum]|uniref:Uncharacterized protein n=1 Tax=Gossypium arboreum TaxID=29729 RepID=A0A0B0PM45_GOSAR|nr:hypothetical protein F383_08753 [Gossypium arboreum]
MYILSHAKMANMLYYYIKILSSLYVFYVLEMVDDFGCICD